MNFRDFDQLVARTRSIRRFDASKPITTRTLHDLINLARLTSSGMNRQPLKYIAVNETDACNKLFSCLAWAAALKDWDAPSVSERPRGYIIILGDTSIHNRFSCDQGIALQTIMLGARARGLGCCALGSVKRDRVREIFNINDRYEILLVMALGVAKEEVKIEPMTDNKNFDYWRDDEGVHHVPKRSLEEVIVKEFTD